MVLKVEHGCNNLDLHHLKLILHCSFIIKTNITLFVLVYVDDIIVASSSADATTCLLKDLKLEFAIKDLGNLHYFLGIEVKQVKDGILLT